MLDTMCSSKTFRISKISWECHYLSIPLYTNSCSEVSELFLRNTLYWNSFFLLQPSKGYLSSIIGTILIGMLNIVLSFLIRSLGNCLMASSVMNAHARDASNRTINKKNHWTYMCIFFFIVYVKAWEIIDVYCIVQ